MVFCVLLIKFSLKILLPNFNPIQKLIEKGHSSEICTEIFKGDKSNALEKTFLLTTEEDDSLAFLNEEKNSETFRTPACEKPNSVRDFCFQANM